MTSNLHHRVVDGREEALDLDEELSTERTRRRGRFSNSLQPASLARIRRVLDVVSSLDAPRLTAELIAEANAEQDLKGALGALRMLDAQGIVHARSGGRRQLIWHPGRREFGEPPRLVERESYLRLRDLLRSRNERWHSTDWLLIEAGLDPDLDLLNAEQSERGGGLWAGLPVNFFLDRGKSARKYVLGALKALYWLECVSWRNYTSQAIEWRWIQPVTEKVVVGRIRLPTTSADPYLLDGPAVSRWDRLTARAVEYREKFQEQEQQWIRDHYPKLAQQFEDRRRAQQESEEARRRSEHREAANWEQSNNRRKMYWEA